MAMQDESNKRWETVVFNVKSGFFSVVGMLGFFSDEKLLKMVGALSSLGFLAVAVSLWRDTINYFTYEQGDDLVKSDRVQIVFSVISAVVPGALLFALDHESYSKWVEKGSAWPLFALAIIGLSPLVGHMGASVIDRSRVFAWSLVFSSFILGLLIGCLFFKINVDAEIKSVTAQIADAKRYSPGDVSMYADQKKKLEAESVPLSLIFALGTASAYLSAGLTMRRRHR